MVQSRELVKYPLAIVAKLLDVFGENLGGGYDIGCQFQITLNNSSLGPLLSSLMTYIKGLGLEDLETCEHTFSKSNSLALALHYASVFHRQQATDSYFEHNDDLEVYANLSNFLHSNYKQALDILTNGNTVLPKVMQDLSVADESVFECWLEEEKIFLEGLTQEPDEETLQMEYWQKLVNLSVSNLALNAAMVIFQVPSHLDVVSYDTQVRNTCKDESARRHAIEDYEKNLRLVQALECKLDVITCWVPEDAEWQNAGRLVANRKYQRALDCLECLIVTRIFGLTKMNRSGTGYKLCKHIAKALQTHSVAIRSALNTYNAIASGMLPPRQTLKWEEVVDYAFLADFDLLCEAHADVSQAPWSSPAARSAMDLCFKMCRAWEEISHLNVEICRLVTCIQDEDAYLRLHNISILPGFSGTLVPGLSVCTGLGESASMPNAQISTYMLADNVFPSLPVDPDTQEELDDEEVEEEEAEEASRTLQDVLLITDDFSRLGLLDDVDVDE
ncbi:hypothetical protein DFH29DRAFT_876763 [Suillus ampliporus]|nr:hypothetical protein DFH29DRAFT_876763 [Suillus ampliporus]